VVGRTKLLCIVKSTFHDGDGTFVPDGFYVEVPLVLLMARTAFVV